MKWVPAVSLESWVNTNVVSGPKALRYFPHSGQLMISLLNGCGDSLPQESGIIAKERLVAVHSAENTQIVLYQIS